MKNKIITISFLAVLYFMLLAGIIMPDREISGSERRKLAAFPAFTASDIYDGTFMKSFEKYALDQFPWRQGFRGIKVACELYLLRKQDTNGLYFVGDQVIKIEYPLRLQSIDNLSGKLNEIYDLYLQGMPAYYSLVPDKNYFAAADSGHLGLDYTLMESRLNEGVANMSYINLFDVLSLNDYYRTDLHWRQENLPKVVEQLATAMNFAVFDGDFTEHEYYPFYGAYYGQVALSLQPDRLVYLTNEVINQAKVVNYNQDPSREPCDGVYDLDRLGDVDSYDVFLSGPTFLTVITNEKAAEKRELIVFRDSYGSSIAPLMLSGYSTITLVDLRYIGYKELPRYIEFGDQDVLFLFSTLVANNSLMLK